MAIFENQSLRQYFTTGIANAGVADIILKYRKPDGVEGSVESPVIEDASIGKYYVDWANDELDVLGTWTFWSYVITTDDGVFPGTPWQSKVVLEGTCPIDKAVIKSILGIDDESQDAAIDYFIPIAIQQYLNIRNAPFDKVILDKEIVGYVYPDGIGYVIAKMYDYDSSKTGYDNMTSESFLTYSYSKSTNDDIMIATYGYPSSIVSKIKRYIRAL